MRATAWRWIVSTAATLASVYVLDAFATVAGLALAASGLADGLDRAAVVALLVAGYLVWGLSLRSAVRANDQLLAETGTSTNVLSKAAHDVTRRMTGSPRAARVAAVVGYAGTELAKEVPYYAGAFGTAAVSDSVTTNHALVFLAGANLGAAAYEYGLARLTRVFLRRRSRRTASFDTDWVPGEYLSEYYPRVQPDEVATIAYLVDALRGADRDRPVLFFGVGPTLHHVFAAAPMASEIHLSDYLPANLAEIQRWLDRDPGAHDWRPFVRYTLCCEGIAAPDRAQVTAREELTRSRITKLIRADAGDAPPIARRYPTVVSAYCADSATADRDTWRLFMRNITGLVEPGGLFVTAALRRCRRYLVAGKAFPCADVDEDDVRAALSPGFTGTVEVQGVPDAHGYASVVLARAVAAPAPGLQRSPGAAVASAIG